MTDFYTHTLPSLTDESIDFSQFKGKVVLIVNTASKCGFTPQYEALQALYDTYHAQGLEILGFPCNQFGAQEPGDHTTIGQFCQQNYGVTFPMFAKVDVNGEKAAPLFQWLKAQAPGILGSEFIKWNFTKFLISKNGEVIGRFAPKDKPASLAKDIESALAAN